jgi:hypothetical protein
MSEYKIIDYASLTMTERQKHLIAKSKVMTADHAMRWLLEFGSDWVREEEVKGTWADYELIWLECAADGDLEIRRIPDIHLQGNEHRLTEKAIAKLKQGETK